MKTKTTTKTITPLLLATTAILLFAAPRAAFAWGQEGHNAVTAIAEANLTPKAKATIEKYLDGRSIIYYAVWMDFYRHTPKYKYTSVWHGAAVDSNFNHTSETTREGGDAVTAIETSIKALRDYKSLPAETVAFHIKILVHAIGDFHCPVHVKYSTIETNFKVNLNGKDVSYHSVWDGDVVQSHKWSHTEWAHQLNRLDKTKIAALTAGAPRDWFHQTALDSRVIYDWAKPGAKLEGTKWIDFLNKAAPLAESQIQKAGYRLAAVLNDLFAQ